MICPGVTEFRASFKFATCTYVHCSIHIPGTCYYTVCMYGYFGAAVQILLACVAAVVSLSSREDLHEMCLQYTGNAPPGITPTAASQIIDQTPAQRRVMFRASPIATYLHLEA